MSFLWNSTIDMSLMCSKNCGKAIKQKEKVIRCSGSCRNVFHCACVGLGESELAIIFGHDNICFRCDACMSFEQMLKENLEKINSKYGEMLSKIVSQQAEMKLHLSERIAKVESSMKESGKFVMDEMSKVADEVAKRVDEKSVLLEATRINLTKHFLTITLKHGRELRIRRRRSLKR